MGGAVNTMPGVVADTDADHGRKYGDSLVPVLPSLFGVYDHHARRRRQLPQQRPAGRMTNQKDSSIAFYPHYGIIQLDNESFLFFQPEMASETMALQRGSCPNEHRLVRSRHGGHWW